MAEIGLANGDALLYGVFHGDLHTGNVLIDASGNFSLVDFGIVGRLDASQRAALVRLVIGFARQDFAAQVQRAVRLLAEHRFRQPTELFLFSKNLLYLNGLANAFAPGVNLLDEVGPVFAYFQAKYPAEMIQILLGSLGSGRSS